VRLIVYRHWQPAPSAV